MGLGLDTMKDRLTGLLYIVRTNFWFIPTILAVLAVAGALLVIELDVAIQRQSFIPLHMTIESARLALSTIAGSMITIASLVFSMTLVSLTSVSQQLGPRILLRFMDDRPTQVVLGIFIATFLYSLIVLMRVGDDERSGVVPGLGVTIAAGLAIAALGGMIHFFDHVAKRIQADSLIGELSRDLQASTQDLVARANSQSHLPAPEEEEKVENLFSDEQRVILVKQPQSGYLRRLNASDICRVAEQQNLVVRVEVLPGQFVLQDQIVLKAAKKDLKNSSEGIEDQLACLMLVADKRTPEATIEFEIDALVEVALRALSPGVNDPFTAIACIDHLSDGIRLLATGGTNRFVTRDSQDTVRLVHQPQPFERYSKRVFDPIVDAARDNQLVLGHIERVLATLTELQPEPSALDELDRVRRLIQPT